MENNEIEQNGKRRGTAPVIIGFVIVIIIFASVYFINHKSENTKEIALPESSGDAMEIQVGASDIALTDTNKAAMEKAITAVNEYFDENKREQRLVSEYAFLYSYRDKDTVSPSAALSDKNTGLTDDEINKYIDILYIRPEDMGIVSGQEIKGHDLALVTVLNTKDGYYCVSDFAKPIILSGEQYKNLALRYSFAHGDIRNPKRGEDENTAILKACNMENYDIKHIACDDKYAVVVGNLVADPADIKEVALTINGEGDWEIVNDSLAQEKDAVMTINAKCPDMDLGLMPVYNIANFGEIDTEDMDGIIDDLAGLGEITDKDSADGFYACGCGRFAFIECLATDKELLGYIGDDGKLQFNKTADLQSSISYMLQLDDDPPVFILKFE